MKFILINCGIFVFALFIALGVLGLWFTAWPEQALAATYTVTNTNDSGAGSLRQAIIDANTNPGADTIDFNIGGGPNTISPTSALPNITEQVTIDGYTEPGASPANGGAATIMIRIDGNSAGTTDGLYFAAGSDNSLVKGVAITRFDNSGIMIDAATGVTVEGNYIGTDVTGLVDGGNTTGMTLQNGANNAVIGGTAASALNLISGNAASGMYIDNCSGCSVQGNLIGTDITGGTELHNTFSGVVLRNGSSGNTVGGSAAGAGNLISGNLGSGVTIDNATGNSVEGNYIGTDINGTALLSNNSYGIYLLNGADNNVIGGTAVGAGNLVSENGADGIRITNSSVCTIQGNYIGTDISGTASLPNTSSGVTLIAGATGNTVGGSSAGAGNLLSGNGGDGISINAADGNFVEGNLIGTNAAGTAALPNGDDGINILATSTGNTIGGTTAAEQNIISGNTDYGVEINNSTANVVSGNRIGTNATGVAALANNCGVGLESGASGNTVGGDRTAGEGNLISGNTVYAVYINGCNGNTVSGNYVGTDFSGTAALANNSDGIKLDNGSNGNTIGGTAAGEGNVVSGNAGDGININGSTGNNVVGNLIGTDAGGTAAVANGDDGVNLAGSANGNTVGGTTVGAGNLISGNYTGIEIDDSTTNSILGNFIGTDVNGTAALANTDGIVIMGAGGTGNIVGGNTTAHMNLISGNSDDGVDLEAPVGNTIQGNFIGTDVSGTSALGNGQYGIEVDSSNDNLIGGSGAGEGNLISGNVEDGVSLDNSTGNDMQGNLIGTNAAGTAALPNGYGGIYLFNGSSGNTIGGTTAGHRNVISGNTYGGVAMAGCTGNFVQGNYIGTDITGAAAVPNNGEGVGLWNSSSGNTIGGTTAGHRNVISGNATYGVRVDESTANTIRGNYIGVDATGSAALGNGDDGIFIDDLGDNNIIGGTAEGHRNVISGNGVTGVRIGYSSGNTVSGNYIGTDASGTSAIANGVGVGLVNSADNNTIGGATSGERNVISGNIAWGIVLDSSSGNDILGNYVGTDAGGASPLPNTVCGICLTTGSGGNTIGGDTAGHRNVVSSNGIFGLLIEDGSDGNTVRGNDIMNSGTTGVMIDSAVNNTITRNSIYDNGDLGIELIFGGNNDYAAPVFSSATFEMNGGTVEVEGTAPTNSDVEIFYTGPVPDPIGSGEGLTYLTTVPSDGSGYFWASLTGLSGGEYISATATSQATGDTSQFGINAEILSPSVVWYLAEGSTGSDANGGFETWVLVQNPTGETANVDVTYMTPQGEVAGPSIALGPDTRWSVNVADTVPDEWHVSTMVEADKQVVVERSVYWNVNGSHQAAHSSIGTMTPSLDWYFAEGSSGSNGNGGFETWVLVQNPTGEVANIDVTYMTQSGEVAGPSFELAPKSRWTTNTADFVPSEWHVAARVSADKPVVAERTMYWNSTSTYRQAAHSSIGATTQADTWYLAEGSTGSDASGSFETWVLVQNPSDNVAGVDITYMTPQGPITGPSIELAPRARWTVNAGDTVPDEWGVSTMVNADRPVIAACSMYWSTPSTYRQAASSSIGATSASNTWYMAEGSTAGGMETYILVQNPGQTEVAMDMKFMTDTGEVQGPQETILPARSRYIYRANDYVESFNVSTMVEATGGVVVVRSMYGDGRAWAHSSIGYGTPTP